MFDHIVGVEASVGSSPKEMLKKGWWSPSFIGESTYVEECAALLAPAFGPCREHAYGSDSAIQCAQRYVRPAIAAAHAQVCFKHSTGDANEICEALAAQAAGDPRAYELMMNLD